MSDFIGPLILMAGAVVLLVWIAGELLPASGRLFRTLRGRGEVDVLDVELRDRIDGAEGSRARQFIDGMWQLVEPPTPLYDQATEPDWPVNLPLRHHPDGAVDVDGLVDEIYAHLEQQR